MRQDTYFAFECSERYHDHRLMSNRTVSGHTDSVEIHLIDVDLVEAVVTQQIMQVIEGFFALDDARVGVHVRAP